MRLLKTLSILALTPALIFGVTACSGTGQDGSSPDPGASTSGPVADPGVSGVINTVEGLYSYITVDDNLTTFNQAGEEIPNDATNEEAMETMTNRVPEAFSFYDTSTYEKTISAYRDLTDRKSVV